MKLLWEQDIVKSSNEFENGCIPVRCVARGFDSLSSLTFLRIICACNSVTCAVAMADQRALKAPSSPVRGLGERDQGWNPVT